MEQRTAEVGEVRKRGLRGLKWAAATDDSEAGVGLFFINTQLQLGAEEPAETVEPFQRFLLTMRLKLLYQFARNTSQAPP
jgi:hypothetical protein